LIGVCPDGVQINYTLFPAHLAAAIAAARSRNGAAKSTLDASSVLPTRVTSADFTERASLDSAGNVPSIQSSFYAHYDAIVTNLQDSVA